MIIAYVCAWLIGAGLLLGFINVGTRQDANDDEEQIRYLKEYKEKRKKNEWIR
jgi:hypothetical protein